MSIAVASASSESSLETLIYSNFQAHQTASCSSGLDEEGQHFLSVRKLSEHQNSLLLSTSQEYGTDPNVIRRKIANHILCAFGGAENIYSRQEDECVDQIVQTLQNIVRITFANVVTFRQSSLTTFNSFKSSGLYEATFQILEMVASLVFAKGDGRLAKCIIELLESFSKVELECIRGIVCQFMTMALNHLFSYTNSGRHAKSINDSLPFLFGMNNDGEEFAWREEIICDIKAILMERLLDKSQAVRLLAIQAVGRLFGTTTQENSSDDSLGLSNVELHEDIIQALLWNLSHDPSLANRSAAIQSLPITIETLPAIVSRTRDAKLKVRVDALEVLCNKVDVKTLTRNQRIEILQNGLSPRYPATYQAATKMLCCGWMKSVKFEPVTLLELLEATSREENDESREIYEDVSVKAARAIIAAASDEFQVFPSISSSSDHNKSGNHSSSPEIMKDLGVVTSDIILADLSPPEVREYKEKVLNWKRFNLGSICKEQVDQIDNDDFASKNNLSPSLILFARTLCDVITESTNLAADKKSSLLSEIVPDVTVLGDAIENHVNRLNEVLMNMEQIDVDDEVMKAYEDEEDQEVFICLNLLKMSKVIDMNEEGSRRYFSNIIHRILCDPCTHADVIEGAVLALSESYDNEAAFLLAISEIMSNVIEIDMVDYDDMTTKNTGYRNPDVRKEQYLRGIEILSVALEKTSRKMSSNPILLNFASTILTAITDISLGPLVREAGVSCLGRFVILLDESTMIDTYKPILMEIAYGEEEKIEIRAQATLALCDLALLFQRMMAPITLGNVSDQDVSLTALLVEMMSQAKKSLAVVAAECAAKLHFTGKIHDARIVAMLLVMYFDKSFVESTNVNDGSAKDVGSPTRLLQLLTVFFPAYSISSEIGRETLKAAVKPLLSIVNRKINTKVKGRKNMTWPIAKMIEYACETLDNGYEAAKENGTATSQSVPKEESPLLSAVIAICNFIIEEVDDISTSFLRAICKILSKSYIDVESENMKSLNLLKQGLEETAMNVTDETAINYVEALVELLDEVESDTDKDEEDVSEKELIEEDAKTTGDDSREPGLRSRISNGDSIPTFASLGAKNDNNESRRSSRSSRESHSGIPLFASIGASEANPSTLHSDPETGSSDASSSSYESSDDSDF